MVGVVGIEPARSFLEISFASKRLAEVGQKVILTNALDQPAQPGKVRVRF